MENPANADFCAECGEKLARNSGNFFNRTFSNWNKKSRNYKIATGVLGCCVGVFIILLIIGAIFPTTNLALDKTDIQIDNQTTTYMLKGTTEVNATIKINSKDLSLTNVEVKPNSDGKFVYQLQIPTNMNQSDVIVTAKLPNKSENQVTATINRPTSSPASSPTNQPAGKPNKTLSTDNYTLQYPSNWELNTKTNSGFSTGNTPGTMKIYNIQIDTWSISEYAKGDPSSGLPEIPATFDAVVNDMQSQREGSYTKKDITVAGLSAIEYADLTPDEVNSEHVFVYFSKGDTLYEISMGTNNYDADRPGFDMILNTFQLK